jgi:hypothetical protein
MSPENAARDLSTDDLAMLQRVREPLRAWLRDTHGRRGLRDGIFGVIGAVVALIALVWFDLSPLLALLHLLLALATAGIGARRAVHGRPDEAARPFASPLHALAFVEAISAIRRPRPFGARSAGLPADCRPYAGVSDTDAMPAGTPAQSLAAHRPRLPPIRGILLLFFGTMAIFMLPLAQAAAARFDRWDGYGLVALLAINAVLLGSAWRATHRTGRDPPWDRDWSIEPPAFGRVMFWKHYRLLPLGTAFMLVLLLTPMGMHARSDAPDRSDFVRTFEARLRPLAIVLFTGSGGLNLLLLAAPWQARRKIALLDAIDPDAASLRPR